METPSEQKETTPIVVVSVFDCYFRLITANSTPGELVSDRPDTVIVEWNRTRLLAFINDILIVNGYIRIAANSNAWRTFLNLRIQESNSVSVDDALNDVRHRPLATRISGKSQLLKLKYYPSGISPA